MKQGTRTAVAAVLAATVLGAAAPAPATAHPSASYQVQVGGKAVASADAFIKGGQLLAATRPLAEAMGAQVEWNGAEQRITIRRSGRLIMVWVGSDTVVRDGIRYDSSAAPVLKEERSFIPVWRIASLLGYEVAWDGRTMRLGTQAQGGGSARSGGKGLWSDHFVFPFPAGARYEPMSPNFGTGRSWTPGGEVQRSHEGQDIMAATGTPVVASGSGTILKLGWNEYGGWRILMDLDQSPGTRLYYAHLNGYGPNLYEGARVRAGQLLGYVGSTGYGPEGTKGKFAPHLHIGLYTDQGVLNPFPYLQVWEEKRVKLP